MYLLQVSLSMFEGEEGGQDAAAIEAAATAAAAAAEASEAAKKKAKEGDKSFNQDQVNAIVAADRRKLAEKYQELEGMYKTALDDKNLTTERRSQLEAKLEEVQKTFLTKEETLIAEKKKLEESLSKEANQWKDAAVRWENQFKQTLMDRTLQDAAVQHEAYNPSQMIALLRPMTKVAEKLDEQGKGTGTYEVVVDLADINSETGAQQVTRRAPEDAVKRMKELKDLYGNLFKTNVVSGIGAGTAQGGTSSGKVDPKKISTAEYMRLRKENPEALGIKKGNR
jgi:vacuolar-type H+-ATPase subunit I/STV1